MNDLNSKRPIGLSAPCAEIEETCCHAKTYQWSDLRPCHLIIPLDSGYGRTTLVEYMATVYKEYGVLDFTSSLDDYIEITFDGTLPQLRAAFGLICSAAEYANAYENIISMDISALATHAGETQYTEFLNGCRQICKHALVVFFVHSVPSRQEEQLLDKLSQTIDSVKRLTVAPYTNEELCALTMKRLTDYGIVIDNASTFYHALLDLIPTLGIATMKEVSAVSSALASFADFSKQIPVISPSCLPSLHTQWQKEPERRPHR